MPVRPTPRRRSVLTTLVLVMFALLVGGGGTVATLFATGVVAWPRPVQARSSPALAPAPQPRTIAIPASARTISAYQMVTLKDLVDPETGELRWITMSPESVPMEALRNPMEIVGRVMRREKASGYAFRESEFLPKGTRQGVVGGTPPGKRAITLREDQLSGVHALRAGDHFDLLASAALDDRKHAETLTDSGAEVRVIVHDGLVILPVTARADLAVNPPISPKRSRDRPVREIIVAVEPEEAAPLSEAITLGMRLMAVARSGHPDDPGTASITPGSRPVHEEVHVTEWILGGRREVRVFPLQPSGSALPADFYLDDEPIDGPAPSEQLREAKRTGKRSSGQRVADMTTKRSQLLEGIFRTDP